MSTSRILAASEVAALVEDDEHGQSLSVRFDNQCVLIPEPPHRHRLPKMVAKSYSLPLWKRRSSSLSGSSSPETDVFVPEHVILRVPIPRQVFSKLVEQFIAECQAVSLAKRNPRRVLVTLFLNHSPRAWFSARHPVLTPPR